MGRQQEQSCCLRLRRSWIHPLTVLNTHPPPRVAHPQMLADLPPLGTALPVVVPQPHGSPPIALPAVGEWVKLKMVGLQLHEVSDGWTGLKTPLPW